MSMLDGYDAGIMAGQFGPEMFPVLDLADEATWEDLLEAGVIECITLVEAGLEEEASAPVFGGFVGAGGDERCSGGVHDVTNWLMDGQINLED